MSNVTFQQTVVGCEEHPDCTVIACHDSTGALVWESHAPSVMHPECRANPDHPLTDEKGKALDPDIPLCDDCAPLAV